MQHWTDIKQDNVQANFDRSNTSYRKSGSLNPFPMTNLWTEVELMYSLRMRRYYRHKSRQNGVTHRKWPRLYTKNGCGKFKYDGRFQTGSSRPTVVKTAVMQIKTAYTSGLNGRHIYFWYNTTSGCVDDNVVEPGDIENMDVCVEMLLLAVLRAEIVLISMWATATSVSGIMRLPVVLATTLLNQATSKIWM